MATTRVCFVRTATRPCSDGSYPASTGCGFLNNKQRTANDTTNIHPHTHRLCVCVPDSVRRCNTRCLRVACACHVLLVSQGTSGTLIVEITEKLADMVSASCVVGALHQQIRKPKESNHESNHNHRNTSS